MWLTKWLPWKFIIKKAARQYGFLDPFTLMARLRRFGHPSEVHEPIELLRAGVIFHARGLINTRVIQYNLDWIWPFWIVKQFRPIDRSFIPRGFAFSHINLTHRNWTAVGHPEMPYYPIVDPKGLVTPYLDGWSVDFWIRSGNRLLAPSEADSVHQHLDLESEQPGIVTHAETPGMQLETAVWVAESSKGFRTYVHARGFAEKGGWLVLSLRPYNPEGIQFIDSIAYDQDQHLFRVNDETDLLLDRRPDKVLFSTYAAGDVANNLEASAAEREVFCDIGMATAAALFPIAKQERVNLTLSAPLVSPSAADTPARPIEGAAARKSWQIWVAETAQLQVPDSSIQFLYDAAVRTLLLLSAEEAYPGPYTYRRFWFRDACLMLNALLGINLPDRVRQIAARFPERQTLAGYFQSQEGEWDSNGQVLWICGRLHQLTGTAYDEPFLKALFKGADWITKKRVMTGRDAPHYGLLPAGFSAEHLGPNDFYYWDDFWGLAGLNQAAYLAAEHHLPNKYAALLEQAGHFRQCIFDSIRQIPETRRQGGIPASPYRRMDAGAIGSLVADYPLQLTPPGDPEIMNTVAYLMKHCFHSNAFFQDMIHAGINSYLTLAIAQTLLRANNPDYRELLRTVADLASPTGQWPEAIHPFTKGGCMGDGQHGWAAAEWVMMIRSLFVREEGRNIVIGSGIFPEWIKNDHEISFGPTLIPGGALSVSLHRSGRAVMLNLDSDQQAFDGDIIIDVPEYERQVLDGFRKQTVLESVN
jgi:hypothetical protein